MKIEVRLFPLDTPAADGSIIPKQSFLEYQNTPRYKERKQNRNFYGLLEKEMNYYTLETSLTL